MKTLETIRRFLLYTAKAVCFERNEPLDVHQYAFGFVSSNLNLPDAVSGWLLTKVGAKRYGTVSGSPDRKPKNFIEKDIMKTLEIIRRFLLYTAKAVCFER